MPWRLAVDDIARGAPNSPTRSELLVVGPAPPPTRLDDLQSLNLSTVLMDIHKDCYSAIDLTRQDGPHRRETLMRKRCCVISSSSPSSCWPEGFENIMRGRERPALEPATTETPRLTIKGVRKGHFLTRSHALNFARGRSRFHREEKLN
jgi:hypothetical protein